MSDLTGESEFVRYVAITKTLGLSLKAEEVIAGAGTSTGKHDEWL